MDKDKIVEIFVIVGKLVDVLIKIADDDPEIKETIRREFIEAKRKFEDAVGDRNA